MTFHEGRVRQAGYDNAGVDSRNVNASPIAPGKRTLTEDIRGRRDPEEDVKHRLNVAEWTIAGIREDLLIPYRVALSARDINAARDKAAFLKIRRGVLPTNLQEARNAISVLHASDNKRKIEDQYVGNFNVINKAMEYQLRLAQLEGQTAAFEREIDEALVLEPPDASRLEGAEELWLGIAPYDPNDPRWAKFDRDEYIKKATWEAALDDYERKLGIASQAARLAAPVRADQECAPDGGISQQAVQGVHLALTFGEKLQFDETLPTTSVGPAQAGPYEIRPKSLRRMLVAYEAFHTQRKQIEWIVGPASINQFAAEIDYYIGAARYAYPGSRKLENTQEDGAENVVATPSLLEQRKTQDPGDLELLNSEGNPNGGSTLVGLKNMHVRLHDYIAEAKRLARDLLVQVRSGEMGHQQGRTAAVDGRNEMLRDARSRMSPSAQYTSRQLKGDQGISLRAMEAKKVKDLLDASQRGGVGIRSTLGQGEAGDTNALRDRLASDSPEWAKYRVELAKIPDDGTYASVLPRKDIYKEAIQKLAAQPVVSEAIINSSGKNNPTITAICRFEHKVALASAVASGYQIVQTLWNAEEGERLHVAAKEFSGFAGGIVGAEAGSAGAVFLASMLIPSPGAFPLMVVSLIGGLVGANVGANAGLGLYQMGAQTAGQAMTWMTAPGAPQGGGYAGLHQREQAYNRNENRQENDLQWQLETDIFELDLALGELGGKIQAAETMEELQQYQRQRIALIQHRRGLEGMMAAYEQGLLTEDEVERLLSGEPQPTEESEQAG